MVPEVWHTVGETGTTKMGTFKEVLKQHTVFYRQCPCTMIGILTPTSTVLACGMRGTMKWYLDVYCAQETYVTVPEKREASFILIEIQLKNVYHIEINVNFKLHRTIALNWTRLCSFLKFIL